MRNNSCYSLVSDGRNVQILAKVQEHIFCFIKLGNFIISYVFQVQLNNTLLKSATMHHTHTTGILLSHFKLINKKTRDKDTDVVTYQAPLIITEINSTSCVTKNGEDTKHISHIYRRIHFVKNGKDSNIHKTLW